MKQTLFSSFLGALKGMLILRHKYQPTLYPFGKKASISFTKCTLDKAQVFIKINCIILKNLCQYYYWSILRNYAKNVKKSKNKPKLSNQNDLTNMLLKTHI